MESIYMCSHWGEARHTYLRQENEDASLVVLFPGKQYSCQLPLLYYAARTAAEQHHDVLMLEYGYQRSNADFTLEQLDIVVDECIQAIKQRGNYSQLIFVSKSIGTVVAGRVSEVLGQLDIPHLYLTPLTFTIPYIQQSRGVVIYGTNDSVFSGSDAASIEGREEIVIHSIKNGSHSLEVESVVESVQIMNHLAAIYVDFFQRMKK